VIYCTHGPAEFAQRLRAEGFNAHPLDRGEAAEEVVPLRQQRLFH
jgi:hypothetical protein